MQRILTRLEFEQKLFSGQNIYLVPSRSGSLRVQGVAELREARVQPPGPGQHRHPQQYARKYPLYLHRNSITLQCLFL